MMSLFNTSLNIPFQSRQAVEVSKRASLALAMAAMSVLAGCGTVGTEPDALAPVETRAAAADAGMSKPGDAGAGAGGTAVTPQSQVATVDLSRSGAAGAGNSGADALAALERVVYFDYDSFAIRDEFKPLLDRYAAVLAKNRGKRLVVEGHTDERGGREYNLALGQKRATAVVQSLTLLGASEAQLEAVSYGKERPASQSGTEEALARNRRAELRDRS